MPGFFNNQVEFDTRCNLGKSNIELFRSFWMLLFALQSVSQDCLYFEMIKKWCDTLISSSDDKNNFEIISEGMSRSKVALSFPQSHSQLSDTYELELQEMYLKLERVQRCDRGPVLSQLEAYIHHEHQDCQKRFKVENDRLTHCLKKLVELNDIQRIVISIGCGHATSQQLPPFAIDQAHTLILNVDQINDHMIHQSQSGQIRLVLGMNIATKFNETTHRNLSLTMFIETMLTLGKQICIVDSRFGASTLQYAPLIQAHIHQYGTQLVVIQSYFEVLPVIRLHSRFFEQAVDLTDQDPLYQLLCKFYGHADRQWADATNGVTGVNQLYFPPELGTPYSLLSEVREQDVFTTSPVSLGSKPALM